MKTNRVFALRVQLRVFFTKEAKVYFKKSLTFVHYIGLNKGRDRGAGLMITASVSVWFQLYNLQLSCTNGVIRNWLTPLNFSIPDNEVVQAITVNYLIIDFRKIRLPVVWSDARGIYEAVRCF